MENRERKNTFSLFEISNNRDKLMGMAAVCIMFCHNTIYSPEQFYNINFRYLRYLFQVGVDIFFLCSGLGCFYSLSKGRTNRDFYKRRVERLLPSYGVFYAILIALYFIFDGKHALEKLYSYSPFSFLISGDLTMWFLPAILIMYLISPLLYRYLLKMDLREMIIGGGVLYGIVIVMFCLKLPNSIFFSRIPSFYFGMILGYMQKKRMNGNVNGKKLLLVTILFATSLISYFILKTNMWIDARIVFFPMCVSSVILLTFISARYDSFVFKKIGAYTLECYLVHVPILGITDLFCYRYITNDFLATWISNLLAIVGAVVMAVILKYTSNKLSKMFKNIILIISYG